MMEIVTSAIPAFTIAVSLTAMLLIGLSGSRPNLREAWTLAASVVKFALVVSMFPIVLSGKVIDFHLLRILPGLDVALRVDALGLLFATTSSLLWIITSLYSIGYMRAGRERGQTRFYCFFAAALSATMGIAFSANLFTLFLFYELLTLSTYPLVIHHQTAESLGAGRRYMTYLLGTSIAFLLSAIFLTYHLSGSLQFSSLGILNGTGSRVLLSGILILFVAGLTKAALMPLHSRLPAAMVAPTPVSALLHAVAVVKAGVFSVLRILFDVFGVDLLGELGLGILLAYFASLTVIIASVAALRQDNLKLRLAYSTISQLAFIVLGACLLTPGGITGSMMNIALHAFGKITLFFCAGAIYVASHKSLVSELDGIGRRMPWTMAAFTIASLSMIGIPPMAGFIGKWYLTLGAIEAGRFDIVLLIIAGSLLTASYLLPVIYAAYFKEIPRGEPKGPHEAPALMLIPLLSTAAAVVLLFFWPSLLVELAGMFLLQLEGVPQ